jgi:hypothetical protein
MVSVSIDSFLPDRLDAEIMGSNPDKGMDVCSYLSIFCCPVLVDAGRYAGPITHLKYSYEASIQIAAHGPHAASRIILCGP